MTPHHALFAHSGADHLALAGLAVVAIAAYGALWMRRADAPRWRLLAWCAGTGVVLGASSPWMEAVAERSFTGHMIQHLLVIVLAAPLLVVAEPVRTATRSGLLPPTALGRRAGRMWRRHAAVIGPVTFVAVLFATHLSSIYDRALRDRVVHEVEHAGYLLGAVLTWAAVLRVSRSAPLARVGIAMGVAAGGALLGMILLTAPAPLIATYEARMGTAAALTDQRAAASIMWIGGMATTVPLLLLGVWRWAANEERVAHRIEALTDRPPA